MPTEAEVMPSAEFVRRLKEEIARSPKQRVNHPFVLAVGEGRASMEQIRRWALQDYQFRRAVPRIAMLRLGCRGRSLKGRRYVPRRQRTCTMPNSSSTRCRGLS